MGNYLRMADRRRIEALLELGWSYRRIQRETGVDREAVARYDPGLEGKFARVPRVVRRDNLKAGIARACLYDPMNP